MTNYQHSDPWCVIEEGFYPSKMLEAEQSFCLSNGYIKQRANFEEYYSGETIQGSYIDGINYSENSDNINWKNGYSHDSNIIINAPNWTGIVVRLNEEVLDLNVWKTENFKRVLNMREGILERTFEAISPKGHQIQVVVKRFLSLAQTEVGAISYTVKSLNFEGRISFMPLIDGGFENKQLNINELLWNVLQTKTQTDVAHLWTQIRRMDFHICGALSYVFNKNNEQLKFIPTKIEKEKVAGFSVGTDVRVGDSVSLYKYVALITSLNYPRKELTENACALARAACKKGWNLLLDEHTDAWAQKWLKEDLVIENDIEALRANRYKIFCSMH